MAHRLKQLEQHSSPGLATPNIDSAASKVLGVLGTTQQLSLFTEQYPNFDLSSAYQVTAAIRDLRIARGERSIGRKIGFTNRNIWDEYNVHAPIWGYVYDTTVKDLSPWKEDVAETSFSLDGIAEPKIEPEIVFGIAKAPIPGMDDDALLDCISWVAHGFEIVHSSFAGWKFRPQDTIAALGLHSGLLIGPRHECSPRDWGTWKKNLAGFEIGIYRDGKLMDRGRGSNVLDSPLASLRHLIGLLAEDSSNPQLAAGEIVTTGTLTKALPVKKGEVWHTELRGIALSNARIRFV